jgi:hypothetical protein
LDEKQAELQELLKRVELIIREKRKKPGFLKVLLLMLALSALLGPLYHRFYG